MTSRAALPDELGRQLPQLAREYLQAELCGLSAPEPAAELAAILAQPGACFVTLTQNNQLRGCIGSLLAHRSLGEDLRSNTYSAAFADPRFPPLTAAELDDTSVEVSVLTAPRELTVQSRAEFLAALRPEVDGVIVRFGYHQATFLPQVWQQLSDPELFFEHLLRKAGLPSGFWDSNLQLATYQVHAWESDAVQ